MLDLCFSEFDCVQTKIELLDENSTAEDVSVRTVFENKFYELKSIAHRILTENSSKYSCNSSGKFTNQQPQQNRQEFSSIKLPVLNIPTFCGDYESWLSFHVCMTSYSVIN